LDAGGSGWDFWEQQTGGVNGINIEEVLSDVRSGILINPLRGIRVVQTAWVV